MTRAIQRRRKAAVIDPRVQALAGMAEALSPGMAQVLERLVAGYMTGVRPQFNTGELMLLGAAGAALSVVNRTPGSAKRIGRAAAAVVSSNPASFELLKVATPVRRIA